jgi:protoporphyrinogen oxidase
MTPQPTSAPRVLAADGALDDAPHVVVVGGGVSGLSAAERLAAGGARVTVLEATGGSAGSCRPTGSTTSCLERGADSVVAAKPATRALCERLGIADRLVGPAVRGAFVYRDGRLRRLPPGFRGSCPPASDRSPRRACSPPAASPAPPSSRGSRCRATRSPTSRSRRS